MTLGTNTSPLAGRSGSKLTARMIKDRLDRELLGNVGLRVFDTERPDTWEVQGRGELQFAVLIEMMRREGFELTIGKPRVVTREVDGKTCEPVERVSIDVPEEYSGVVIQALALRKGRMEQHDQPRHRLGAARPPDPGPRPARLPVRVPDRDPRHRHPAPRVRRLRAVARRDQRPPERLADRRPRGPGLRLRDANLQERGVLFVSPGEECYEGMMVGENTRADDLDVNITKAKQMTNVRSNADVLVRLNPPHRLSLDQAIEYIQEGECVEVTPDVIGCARPCCRRPGARATGRRASATLATAPICAALRCDQASRPDRQRPTHRPRLPGVSSLTTAMASTSRPSVVSAE